MARLGLRSTDQRRLIIDTLFQVTDHITVEELLRRVRAVDKGVGYATVYRTLRILSDGNILSERRFEDGITRYELADEKHHHDHLICTSCGTITEFEDTEIEALQERVAKRAGFVVKHHRHELYGICAACRQTGR